MKKYPALLLLLYCCLNAAAQRDGRVKGFVFDTVARQPVSGATITLLQKKDSSLVSFTLSGNEGGFELAGLANGAYRLLVTHINYHSSNSFFVIDEYHRQADLGKITLTDKSKLLREVIITAETPPVTLLGDTIQYNAGSFRTVPNASVEELLKKLPGVKVDRDGTVKAQGEKVKKVLVDGKEFFGNDPKMATKNLPADAVDKVQVFNKLSDQAQLTGFDDGNSEKTINLQLKKDKKKGYFGKAMAGGGDNGRHQERFNINSYKGARQLSVLGTGNNINVEGFSFMDILNFTGALNRLKGGNGDININIADDDPLSVLLGGSRNGINTNFGSGINYNNIIGRKTDFQGSYFYSRYNPNKESNIRRQYFLPVNLYSQDVFSDNLNNNHRFNFSADWQIDSFHSLKISPSIGFQRSRNSTLSDYTTISDKGVKTNDGHNSSLAGNEGNNLSANLLFRKKFRRAGRTFSVNLFTNINSTNGNSSLQSSTNFYDPAGALLQQDSLNQQSRANGSIGGYTARVVYTEPVFKYSLLEFSTGNGFNRNSASKNTYDYNRGNGKFDLVNTALTNEFESAYGYTAAGLRLRKQTRKYQYAAGLSLQESVLKGKIFTGKGDSLITRNFVNLLPNARFRYFFSAFKNITLNYGSSINQPALSQLQPVPDNSNPLYIKLGNPDLKPEYTHALRMNLSLVNPYLNRNFFAFFTLQQTQNKIVNYDRINSMGVDSVQPVNVSGVYNFNGSVSWGIPLRFVKGRLELGTGINSYRGTQFINSESNTIKTFGIGPEVRLDMNPSGQLTLSLGATVNYSRTAYSLPSIAPSRYITREYTGSIDWQLPARFLAASDFTYTIYNQYASGFDARVPLWNASLSKQLLRYNRGELKVSVNDILNRNTRVSRSSNQNYTEDTRVNSLRRFFLLSFTYSLTKTALNNAGKGGEMRVMMR